MPPLIVYKRELVFIMRHQNSRFVTNFFPHFCILRATFWTYLLKGKGLTCQNFFKLNFNELTLQGF